MFCVSLISTKLCDYFAETVIKLNKISLYLRETDNINPQKKQSPKAKIFWVLENW